jgi:hypothetical protein
MRKPKRVLEYKSTGEIKILQTHQLYEMQLRSVFLEWKGFQSMADLSPNM